MSLAAYVLCMVMKTLIATGDPPINQSVRSTLHTVHAAEQEDMVVEELHRKLGTAKEEVDLAQAKKEELWEK